MEEATAEREQRLVDFGNRVRLLRRRSGLSQEQLAHEAGLHRVTVGLIERAQREVGVTTVIPLATALGVDPGALFSVDGKV